MDSEQVCMMKIDLCGGEERCLTLMKELAETFSEGKFDDPYEIRNHIFEREGIAIPNSFASRRVASKKAIGRRKRRSRDHQTTTDH